VFRVFTRYFSTLARQIVQHLLDWNNMSSSLTANLYLFLNDRNELLRITSGKSEALVLLETMPGEPRLQCGYNQCSQSRKPFHGRSRAAGQNLLVSISGGTLSRGQLHIYDNYMTTI
jgi:hypothetical protein